MFVNFELQKAVQAAAVLLRAHRRRMSNLRLAKLLYIADRESVRRSARPIVGCHAVAMDDGPVHREVYDLIRGEHFAQESWSRFIGKDGFMAELENDPGVLDLSRQDVQILNDVAEANRNLDDWQLVNSTRQFEEWKKNWSEGLSRDIAIEDVLEAVGFAADERRDILDEIEEEKKHERQLKASGELAGKASAG